MKKNLHKLSLIVIIVWSFSINSAFAQAKITKPKTSTITVQKTKPTREETVRFIDKTLKLRIGSTFDIYGIDTSVNESDFSINKFEEETLFDLGVTLKIVYSDIPWDQLTDISIDTTDNSIFLYFNTNKMKETKFYDNKAETPEYVDVLEIHLTDNIREKQESLKKAFERMTELAKEEDKDPF